MVVPFSSFLPDYLFEESRNPSCRTELPSVRRKLCQAGYYPILSRPPPNLTWVLQRPLPSSAPGGAHSPSNRAPCKLGSPIPLPEVVGGACCPASCPACPSASPNLSCQRKWDCFPLGASRLTCLLDPLPPPGKLTADPKPAPLYFPLCWVWGPARDLVGVAFLAGKLMLATAVGSPKFAGTCAEPRLFAAHTSLQDCFQAFQELFPGPDQAFPHLPSHFSIPITVYLSGLCLNGTVPAGRQWLTPGILFIQEAEIRRITVLSKPGQIVQETLSRKNPSQKKGWWSGSRHRL
jgi:hypothetical protein